MTAFDQVITLQNVNYNKEIMKAQTHLVSVLDSTTAQSRESVEINITSPIIEETAKLAGNSVPSPLSTNSTIENADGDAFNETTPTIIKVSAGTVSPRINPIRLIGKDVEQRDMRTPYRECSIFILCNSFF